MPPLTTVDPENGSRLIDRIRWGNLGRAALVAAAVALVLLWPRLGSRSPELPAAAAVPADRAPGEVVRPARAHAPAAQPREFDFERRSRRRTVHRARAHPAEPRVHRSRARSRSRRGGHRGATNALELPRTAVRPPPPDPVADEFGVG